MPYAAEPVKIKVGYRIFSFCFVILKVLSGEENMENLVMLSVFKNRMI